MFSAEATSSPLAVEKTLSRARFSGDNLQWQHFVCPSKISCVEPAISLHSHHVSLVQWSTRLLPAMRNQVQSPGGFLCDTGILLLALSRYIGDPSVIDHCGLVWGGALSRTITRPLYRQYDNPTWSYLALLSRFHAPGRSSFQLYNCHSRLMGGTLWRACNLTSFTPCLTGPVDYRFKSRHEEPGFNPQGYLCETRILR